MGKWAARIGLHYITFPDFHLSGIPETSASTDVFDKKKVELDYVFIGDKVNDRHEETLKFNLSEIIPVKKENGRYSLDYDKFDLEKTLWGILKKKKIEVKINPYVVAVNYDDPAKSTIYFLRGNMHEEEIMLSTRKVSRGPLRSFSDILWLRKNNLRYDQCY
jgi:hypothetical protein